MTDHAVHVVPCCGRLVTLSIGSTHPSVCPTQQLKRSQLVPTRPLLVHCSVIVDLQRSCRPFGPHTLCLVWAWEHFGIHPPRFLADCLKKRLNQASFVLLWFKLFAFYPRDAMLARVIGTATCMSVRLSVCPSVTRRYCVKTKKASGMISSPSGSPKTLVFDAKFHH